MFNYFDLIVIGIFIIGIIIGTCRGFIKSLTKLFTGTINLILSYVICKPLGKLLLNKTKLGEHMFGNIANKFAGLSSNFSVNLSGLPKEEIDAIVNNAFSDSNVPKFIRGLLKGILNITPESVSETANITLAEICARALSILIFCTVSFIVMLLLLSLLMFLLNKLSHHILHRTIVLAKVDRSLGALVGALSSFVFICFILSVVYLLRGLGFIGSLIDKIQSSFLGGPIYNFVLKIIENSATIQDSINTWIKSK